MWKRIYVKGGGSVTAENRIKTYISGNEITANFDSGSSTFYMLRGIDLQNNLKEIEITANRITNFNNYGIFIKGQGTVNNLITNNQINHATSFSNPLAPVAIIVNETITSTTYNLEIKFMFHKLVPKDHYINYLFRKMIQSVIHLVRFLKYQ